MALIFNTAKLFGRLNSGQSGKFIRFVSDLPQFETLAVSVPKKNVYHVELNRPNKLNTFNTVMWKELDLCFAKLSETPACRAIVLSGQGKHFTGGIDLNSLVEEESKTHDIEDAARKARFFHRMILTCQRGISAIEECVKPVLAVTHNACVGAGIDLITAADIRYCTADSWFQVKEVDVGLAADVGTLQRLPKVIGNTSTARELCYTARKMDAKEALELGLVTRVYPDRDTAIKEVLDIATTIASKSPVAVQMTKVSLVYSQSRPNQDGLDHIRYHNQALLQSEDLKKSAMASAMKTQVEFEDY
ncbi:delta(3,5)-Delta(2,4)-dienoyl-CoA isomerase, mitochondrial [Aricia agestis]|uniref:delta(3,5)-Delta(2,4)-dienoyl-CoA isomerase, mitochondrial n=1 Tax=Aricia agestis TaxID=91739 RepID=UPI001C2068F8|nr:delta(3,5)-Delta(2,4)-dienoyl-CoA isomerase, mitochondrial [Aricia agestis]XP_041985722.1 delta(3,5)-Delta(2,4)-dienoyl-CoA isomerase, mitochondrial [Aricia agestis]